MNCIQNLDGHFGVSSHEYPIAANTAIERGAVVKFTNGKVVLSGESESGVILGIAAEGHSGTADVFNTRSNGQSIMVYDNPGVIFECPVPTLTAASGSATTLVPASGDIYANASDDTYNGATLVLVKKAAGSTNSDPLFTASAVTDYAKSGTVLTKESGGTPYAGDVYEVYPAIGSGVCALSTKRKNAAITAAGASALQVVGHDRARHCIRLMAVKHELATDKS